MATRLQIILRNPITIVKDHGVGGGQVYAETSGAPTHQELKAIRVGFTIASDGLLTQLPTKAAVYALHGLEYELVILTRVFDVQFELFALSEFGNYLIFGFFIFV
jgi:hypothetical protein